MYTYKIKCKSETDYNRLKSLFNYYGIEHKQKPGKSLKVECNIDELYSWLCALNIAPISVKSCRKKNDPVSVIGYRASNRFDGFGLQEEYDLIKSMDSLLPPGGIHCADDIDEYRKRMYIIDPSGLTRAIYENSGRGFRTDKDYNEGDYGYDDDLEFDNGDW